MHPCFITPGSGWEKDSKGKNLHWNTDNYFYEGAYEQKLGEKEKVLFYHRTLTTYVNAFLEVGFHLEEIIEPKPPTEVIERFPSFEEDLKCADFIIFKLRKN